MHNEKNTYTYIVLATLFSVLLILSNMVGAKIVYIPWLPNFPLTSGIITYPITFILTDIVTEVWGSKRAKFMVYLAFSMNVVTLIFVQVILTMPGHPFWHVPNNPFGYDSLSEYQTAFNCVFNINDKILMGSMLAFLSAQLIDIKIFSFIKKLTFGKKLWLRNNVSTCTSQFIDTIIVNYFVLIWGLKVSIPVAMTIVCAEYLYKIIFALCDTPFVYLGVHYMKKFLGENDYKRAT